MKKTKRQLSSRELGVLSKMGATPTLDSGRVFGDTDGVIRRERFTKYRYYGMGVEVKSTDNNSFSIKREYLDKVLKQSRDYGRMPLFVVDFGKNNEFITLRLDDFLAILDDHDEFEQKVRNG